MRYYKARQNKEGKYHFTCKHNSNIYPVGNCSLWDTCPDCNGHCMLTQAVKCDACSNKGIISKTNPCPGHDTPEAAVAHYKEYLLDEAWYKGKQEPPQPCEICKEITDGIATCGEGKSQFHVLCDKHRTREYLAQVMKDVVELWIS